MPVNRAARSHRCRWCHRRPNWGSPWMLQNTWAATGAARWPVRSRRCVANAPNTWRAQRQTTRRLGALLRQSTCAPWCTSPGNRLAAALCATASCGCGAAPRRGAHAQDLANALLWVRQLVGPVPWHCRTEEERASHCYLGCAPPALEQQWTHARPEEELFRERRLRAGKWSERHVIGPQCAPVNAHHHNVAPPLRTRAQ